MNKAQIRYEINNCYDSIDKNNREITKSLEWQEEILEIKRRLENALSDFIQKNETSIMKIDNMKDQFLNIKFISNFARSIRETATGSVANEALNGLYDAIEQVKRKNNDVINKIELLEENNRICRSKIYRYEQQLQEMNREEVHSGI